MSEKDCQHDWKYVKDWEGDPSVPNGTRDCSYWTCTKCDELSDEVPDGYEDDFYGPEVDRHDYYDKEDLSVDFVYDPFRDEP